MRMFTEQEIAEVRNLHLMRGASDVDCVNYLLGYRSTENVAFTPNELRILLRALKSYESDPDEQTAVASMYIMLSGTLRDTGALMP